MPCSITVGQQKVAHSPKENRQGHWQVSARAGLTQFFGELNSQDMQANAGIGVAYWFNRRIGLILDYGVGKIGGERIPFFNSYFTTSMNEIDLLVSWNITEQFNRAKTPVPFNIKTYAGLGIINFNAKAYDIGTNDLLRFSNSPLSKRNQLFLKWGNPHGPSGIKNTRERVIPIGVALDFRVLPRLAVGLDYRFCFVRTDKLDATSGYRLINPEEHTTYSDTPNDRYSFLAFSLVHRFGKNVQH
ncbi:hypothetical protein [Dyadobacter tibetensis]|uniref:hypothetical protein n=1 Tax=Dyadobacter tibetensis TaxID=1211851 RepID=UPI000471E2FB|nr:hypothetical protein [Dyadobacter tibetensis]